MPGGFAIPAGTRRPWRLARGERSRVSEDLRCGSAASKRPNLRPSRLPQPSKYSRVPLSSPWAPLRMAAMLSAGGSVISKRMRVFKTPEALAQVWKGMKNGQKWTSRCSSGDRRRDLEFELSTSFAQQPPGRTATPPTWGGLQGSAWHPILQNFYHRNRSSVRISTDRASAAEGQAGALTRGRDLPVST